MVAHGVQALGSVFAVALFTEPHLSLVETLQVEKICGRSFCICAYSEGGAMSVWSRSECWGVVLGTK